MLKNAREYLKRKQAYVKAAVAGSSLGAIGSAHAVSIVDYHGIMTQVTNELTIGIAAAAAGIGLIWGARVGVRFVKSLLN